MQIFLSIFWWMFFCIFFSGYPLVYIFFHLISKNKNAHHWVTEKVYPMLPLTYAFVATWFWLFMLFSGKLHFVFARIALLAPSALVVFYSLSALLFWIPSLRKKPGLSLIHSLPLFLLPFIDMILKTSRHKIIPHDYISTLIRIYTAGIIIYVISLVFLFIVKWIFSKILLIKIIKTE